MRATLCNLDHKILTMNWRYSYLPAACDVIPRFDVSRQEKKNKQYTRPPAHSISDLFICVSSKRNEFIWCVCVYPVFEYNTRCKFKNITMSCRQKIKAQTVFETKINRYVQISFFIGHFWVKLCNLFYASINVNGTGACLWRHTEGFL